MPHRPRTRKALVPLLAVALVGAAACASDGDAEAMSPQEAADAASGGGGDGGGGASGGAGLTIDDDAGLTGDGAELAGDLAGEAPRYRLDATIEPEGGRLDGRMHADLPVGPGTTAHLRFFPAEIDPSASVTEVTVDGEPAEFRLEASLLTVQLGGGDGGSGGGGSDGDRAEVVASFAYEIPEIAESDPLADLGASLGEGLQPEDIGLLGRGDGIVTLGHWFPVWIPGGSAEPDPQGFGDIGNFPAAVIEGHVEVPEGWTLVSGGVRVGEGGGGGTVVEGAVGLRDLGMVLVRDAETREVEAGSATVRVVAAPGTEPAALDEVARETATSVETLSDAFGPYPWTELDVVAAPLGSGVGGMEWPGMIWIEQTIFQGGIPGMGDLGGLGDLGDLGDLGELGDLGGLLGGLDPEMLATVRPWTVAHEVGHEWWHAVVGNDSMLAPVVDEPLAQYSACLVYQRAWPDNADAACDFNIDGGYEQMRMMGEEDAPAAQPSDAFTSSLQYGGVVYGKAPGVYEALAAEFGEDAVVEALAGVVSEHAFQQISVDQLHATLAERLGDRARIDALWTRWIEETHGDEDLGVDPDQLGGLGDLLGGLGDLEDLGSLDDLGDLENLSEEDLAAILAELGLGE